MRNEENNLKQICLRRRLQRAPLTSRGGAMGALDCSLRERDEHIYISFADRYPTPDFFPRLFHAPVFGGRDGQAWLVETRHGSIPRHRRGTIASRGIYTTPDWRALALPRLFLPGIACQEGATGSRSCISLYFGGHQDTALFSFLYSRYAFFG